MLEFSPLSHLIAFGLLGWLYVMFGRAAEGAEQYRARLWLVGFLFAWAVISSVVAYRGYYLAPSEDFPLMLIGIAVPYALLTSLALASRSVRQLLGRFVDRTPLESLALVHVVRIAALGTVYKWYIGALPGHFIIPVGIPDFLIGLSAYWMSRRGAAALASRDGLFVAWNVAGTAILLLAVPLIFASQPGPLQLFTDGPRTDEVLSFPMSIVPTLAAPLFIALHGAALLQVRRSSRSRSRALVEPDSR